MTFFPRPRYAPLLVAAVTLPLLAGLAACNQSSDAQTAFPTTAVERGSLMLSASADGVIEPIRKVEVKSKASGEVISMTVDTGDRTEQGQVLLQLLPRDAQNAFDQATADLDAAEARLDNAKVKLERSRRLHQEGLLAAADLELDELAVTTANTDVVRARKSLDNAAERLAETTVRSPIAGTVIAKSVEVGQVVSSAVSQVSGGTLLLTLADLAEVQIRSLVDEVDIGKVKPGQQVTIRVEAYSDRRFQGEVLKVEPQAVVQQNVTMFPVLTRIDNREGLLKPGMNAEIEILIDRRDGVLVLQNEALKRPEEARSVAALLGLALLGPEGAAAGGGEGRERPQGTNGEGSPGGPAEGGGRRDDGRRVIFVQGPDGTLAAKQVTIGLRNYEVAEIVSGAAEGEQVVLLPSATQLRSSAEFRQRMERMRGIPGMSGGSSSRRSSGGSG